MIGSALRSALTAVLVSLSSFSAHSSDFADSVAPVDWAQPPVACAEEVVPKQPNRPCLNLTGVVDPRNDWPSLDPAEFAYWKANKQPLIYCRAKEVLRREDARPGSFSSGIVEISWMQFMAAQNTDKKVAAIYEASRKHELPAQVLTGALYQESLFSELGIADDGGNFSCGVGQINISEWCRWMNTQPLSEKKRVGWPRAQVNCALVKPEFVKPFYDIAKTRLNGEPEYRLMKTHFANIALKDVIASFPPAPEQTQAARFQLVQSFIQNCSDPHDGILAKANELASLYRLYVPAGLKARDTYLQGKQYQRACREKGYIAQYPLHSGWLLAVGAYNAGPRAVDSLAHYNGWSADDLKNPATFEGFTPAEMIKSLYWSGTYNKTTDKIDFTTVSGAPTNWIWFKPCVLQRHIARVVQHVVLPGNSAPVDTLEGAYKCAKSKFNPQTGELEQTAVPPHRQVSSGKK